MLKRILLPAFLVAVSCSQELVPELVDCGRDAVPMAFSAGMESSRTALDGMSVKWESGDEISIFDGFANRKFMTSDSGGHAVFHGNAVDSGEWYALYPYYSSSGFSKDGIQTYIKTCQKGRAGSFGRKRNLSIGHTDGNSFEMKNVCSLVKFTLTQSDITSVTLQGALGEAVSGSVVVSLDGDGNPVTALASGCSYATLVPESGETFIPGVYFLAIRPTCFEHGFRLSFTRSTDNRYAVISSSSRAECARSAILNLGTVDGALEWNLDNEDEYDIIFINPETGRSEWPFTSPGSISNSGDSPSYPGVVTAYTTPSGYSIKVFASLGVFRVSSASQGFKLMGSAGDYIEFPAVEGRYLSSVTVTSGASGMMRIPLIAEAGRLTGVDGGEALCVPFGSAGDSHTWALYGTKSGAVYRMIFTNKGEDAASAARIQRIIVRYSALPHGNPAEEREAGPALKDTIPDFSRIGYHFGDDPVPDCPVTATLEAPSSSVDASGIIQAAIDAADGRGAILLKQGTYYLDRPVLLNRSGVVLRGEGNSTVLMARGIVPTDDEPYPNMIVMGRSASNGMMVRDYSSAAAIIEDAFCGQMYVCVDNPATFSAGDRVLVSRVASDKWISDLKMDCIFENGGNTEQWEARNFNMSWERIVTDVRGDRIYFENPIVMSITKEYGGGSVMKCSLDRVSECGLENLRMESVYDPAVYFDDNDPVTGIYGRWGRYLSDENHCWRAVLVTDAEHCWIRNCTNEYFAGALVRMNSGAKNITVENCHSLHPVSEIRGSRRYAFYLASSQLCLVRNCTAEMDRHAFVTGPMACGPNAFVRCSASEMYEDVGPHFHWATGCLYDNVTTDYNFTIQDRADAGTGHGWAGANFVCWNCGVVSRKDGLAVHEGYFVVQKPWVSATNWAVGCTGAWRNTTRTYKDALGLRPDGEWISKGVAVLPESLYEEQLEKRKASGQKATGSGKVFIETYKFNDSYFFD